MALVTVHSLPFRPTMFVSNPHRRPPAHECHLGPPSRQTGFVPPARSVDALGPDSVSLFFKSPGHSGVAVREAGGPRVPVTSFTSPRPQAARPESRGQVRSRPGGLGRRGSARLSGATRWPGAPPSAASTSSTSPRAPRHGGHTALRRPSLSDRRHTDGGDDRVTVTKRAQPREPGLSPRCQGALGCEATAQRGVAGPWPEQPRRNNPSLGVVSATHGSAPRRPGTRPAWRWWALVGAGGGAGDAGCFLCQGSAPPAVRADELRSARGRRRPLVSDLRNDLGWSPAGLGWSCAFGRGRLSLGWAELNRRARLYLRWQGRRKAGAVTEHMALFHAL
nr:translation initiation factor IF-2-like [Pongo pygmaeus]